MRLASGALTLPGTDAGCSPCTFDDYLHELAQFKQWGMSEFEIMRAASADAAQALGRSGRFGSVTTGKWANIIVSADAREIALNPPASG